MKYTHIYIYTLECTRRYPTTVVSWTDRHTNLIAKLNWSESCDQGISISIFVHDVALGQVVFQPECWWCKYNFPLLLEVCKGHLAVWLKHGCICCICCICSMLLYAIYAAYPVYCALLMLLMLYMLYMLHMLYMLRKKCAFRWFSSIIAGFLWYVSMQQGKNSN